MRVRNALEDHQDALVRHRLAHDIWIGREAKRLLDAGKAFVGGFDAGVIAPGYPLESVEEVLVRCVREGWRRGAAPVAQAFPHKTFLSLRIKRGAAITNLCFDPADASDLERTVNRAVGVVLSARELRRSVAEQIEIVPPGRGTAPIRVADDLNEESIAECVRTVMKGA